MNSTVEQVMADLPLHPFSPFVVELPTYVANTFSAAVLVSIFAAGCCVIFLVTYGLIQRMRPSMGNGEMLVAMWFALCGCIHLFFEGERACPASWLYIEYSHLVFLFQWSRMLTCMQATSPTMPSTWLAEQTSLASSGKSMPSRILVT